VDRAGLELTAEHVAGVDNRTADRLSRISPGGDYARKTDKLQLALTTSGVQIDVDFFAASWNKKHQTYFTLARDRNAYGRNVFLADWTSSGFLFCIHLCLFFPKY
jgi:hypothetical protein